MHQEACVVYLKPVISDFKFLPNLLLRDNRGSYSGRSSRDSPPAGGHSRRPGGEVITEDRASNVLQGAADTDRDKLEDKTKTIIDEYLQVCQNLISDFVVKKSFLVAKTWFNVH